MSNLHKLDKLNEEKNIKDIKDFDRVFEPIIPFNQFNAPDISCFLLPDEIGNHAKDVASHFNVPEALPIMTALGIISTAVNKKFIISPKKDWNEPINIYALIGMPSGSTKSPVLSRMLKPIVEWEKQKLFEIQPIKEQKEIELKALELQLKKVEREIHSPKEKTNISKSTQDFKRLSLQINEAKKNIPIIPKVHANNLTPEALEQYVYEQNNRFSIITDEGGILETLSGLYSNGNANIDILLKGIDGGDIRTKRQNREYNLNPYLSLLLVVQPQIIKNMSGKKTMQGNGMVERFLYAIPQTRVGYNSYHNKDIHKAFENQYFNQITKLMHIETPEEPYSLNLSISAHMLWTDFHDAIQKEMREDGSLYICRSWASKLAGYTLRIAGLLHVSKYADISNLEIEEATMRNAISLANLLEKHTLVAFGLMSIDEATGDAQELLKWFITRAETQYTMSEITSAMRNRKMGERKRLDKAKELLIERNFISKLYQDNSTQKPTGVYFVNPEILK